MTQCEYGLTSDGLGLNVDVDLWSNCEPCIGIYCACLPVLGPIFKSISGGVLSTARRSKNSATYGQSWRTPDGSGQSKKASDHNAVTSAGFSRLDGTTSESEHELRPYNPAGHNGQTTSRIVGGNGVLTPSESEAQGSWPMEGIKVKSDVEWSSANPQ